MKNLVVTLIALFSLNTFAGEKMGEDAVEMFKVLSHHQVVECIRNAPSKMVNISINKMVARCPGCNTYTITGHELVIDTPSTKETKITIKGRGIRNSFGGIAQTYTCDIEN